MIWKFLTGIIRCLIYRHLSANGPIPPQQKGSTQNSKGTKDQLLVAKMIMLEAKQKRKNLFMAWIDFKKPVTLYHMTQFAIRFGVVCNFWGRP